MLLNKNACIFGLRILRKEKKTVQKAGIMNRTMRFFVAGKVPFFVNETPICHNVTRCDNFCHLNYLSFAILCKIQLILFFTFWILVGWRPVK